MKNDFIICKSVNHVKHIFSINMHYRVWIYFICISVENFGTIENVFSFFTEYNLIPVNFDPENRCRFCKQYISIWKGDWTSGLNVVQWIMLSPGLCIHFINEWNVPSILVAFSLLSVFWFVRLQVLCHWLYVYGIFYIKPLICKSY